MFVLAEVITSVSSELRPRDEFWILYDTLLHKDLNYFHVQWQESTKSTPLCPAPFAYLLHRPSVGSGTPHVLSFVLLCSWLLLLLLLRLCCRTSGSKAAGGGSLEHAESDSASLV